MFSLLDSGVGSFDELDVLEKLCMKYDDWLEKLFD